MPTGIPATPGGQNIQTLLGLPSLMGVVEETTNGLPQEKFLPREFKTITRDVIGNQAQAVLQQGQRRVSKVINYGAPPVGARLETLGTQHWILLQTSEIVDISPQDYQNLRAYDSWMLQNKGMEEIGRQIGLFIKKADNLESSVLMYFLNSGVVYLDGAGNLLPAANSGSAAQTLTMAIPSSNQGQLPAGAGGANLITASWAYPNTNIPNQLRSLRQVAAQTSGYRPTQAGYGINIPGYLEVNSYMQQYWTRNPRMNEQFLATGEIPNGLLDFDWIPFYEGFYQADDVISGGGGGTNYVIMPQDQVTFYPKIEKTWYELLRGSVLLPNTINIITDVMAAMDQATMVYGMFSFAQFRIQSGYQLGVTMGNTSLPTVKVPNAVWQATVAGF